VEGGGVINEQPRDVRRVARACRLIGFILKKYDPLFYHSSFMAGILSFASSTHCDYIALRRGVLNEP
jgi:hypothetical protein